MSPACLGVVAGVQATICGGCLLSSLDGKLAEIVWLLLIEQGQRLVPPLIEWRGLPMFDNHEIGRNLNTLIKFDRHVQREVRPEEGELAAVVQYLINLCKQLLMGGRLYFQRITPNATAPAHSANRKRPTSNIAAQPASMRFIMGD
jgi:hypothetical protein